MKLDRANVLLLVARALEHCFPEQRDEVLRELETRLPTSGRNHNDLFNGAPPWWRTQDGRWCHTHDMSTEHIINTVGLLQRGGGGQLARTQKRRVMWIEAFEKELVWRTK